MLRTILQKPHFSLIFRGRDDLNLTNGTITQENIIKLAEQCTKFEASRIYLEQDGSIFYVTKDNIQKKDGELACGWLPVERCLSAEYHPEAWSDSTRLSEEIKVYFNSEFEEKIIPVIENGAVIGEYHVEARDSNRLHVNVREAMRFFGKQIVKAMKARHLIVLCEKQSSLNTMTCDCDTTDLRSLMEQEAAKREICSLSYNEDILKLLGFDNTVSFYEIYGKTIIHEAVSFFNQNQIHFTYIEGPNRDKINLSQQDIIDLKKHIPLRDIQEYPNLIDQAFPDNERCRKHLHSGGAVRFPIYYNGVHNALGNIESEYVNIVDGKRVTPGAPSNWSNTVFLFGACDICGATVTDDYTIPKYLQECLNNKYPGFFRVENCGIGGRSIEFDVFAHILSTSFSKGDHVILQFYFNDEIVSWIKNDGVTVLQTHQIFNSGHSFGHWSVGAIAHANDKVNKRIADFYFENVKWHLTPHGEGCSYGLDKFYVEEYGLNEYLKQLSALKRADVTSAGAIVITGNPFTKGHQQLIEYAAQKCEWLYVFVITMETFRFSFKDRYKMALDGTQHLKNVTVIPSGEFFGTLLHFGEYSSKECGKKRTIHPEKDNYMFGKYIAPALGIKTRFLGEEKEDEVTRQFNIILSRDMPKHGIDVVIVPRFESEGEKISAKLVRKLLDNKEYDIAEKYLPKTTLAIVEKNTLSEDKND